MNYRKWIHYFELNRNGRREPVWDAHLSIDDDRQRALAWSLAEYQLGDGGGPCRLIARDAEWFRATAVMFLHRNSS